VKLSIEPTVRTLKPGVFPLYTMASRAAARAMLEAKKQDPNIVNLTCYGRDPNLAPEFLSSFTDKDGQSWEVYEVSPQRIPDGTNGNN
jgi:hypothetical protein